VIDRVRTVGRAARAADGELELGRETVVRFCKQREATGGGIYAVQRLNARHHAPHPAVAFLVHYRGAPADFIVDHRTADGPLHRIGTVVARPGGDVTVVGGQARILGVEADRTPGRVLAVQGPLRTTQHLDAIEVVGLQCLDGADALVDFVDVHGDRAA